MARFIFASTSIWRDKVC